MWNISAVQFDEFTTSPKHSMGCKLSLTCLIRDSMFFKKGDVVVLYNVVIFRFSALNHREKWCQSTVAVPQRHPSEQEMENSSAVLVSLVASRISSLLVLEFSLRTASAWSSAGLVSSPTMQQGGWFIWPLFKFSLISRPLCLNAG